MKWTIENEGWFGKSMTVRRHTWHVITEYVTEIDTCQVCVWREREGGGRGDELSLIHISEPTRQS